MASIEKEVQNGLLNVVSGVTGVSFFHGEESTDRTLPNIVVQSSITSEEIIPFSGVFRVPASITYTARADTTSRTDFDAKFSSLISQLYRTPTLESYLTDATNITVYNANITAENSAIVANNRTWARTISVEIVATAKK